MKTHLLVLLFFLTTALCIAQWSFTDLTEPKFRMGVTSLGTKVYFAGGELSSGEQVSAIEVYDIALDEWDTVLNLVFPRSHITCVSCGTKVFFAGGIDFGTLTFYDIIEIWDTETGQWDFKQLLAPRFSISAVSYGNKVMFAGGANFIQGTTYDLVEIYDIETGEWTTTTLSMPRNSMGAAVVGDLAFFAGGANSENITDRVDIYNFTTDTWDIASLSQARTFLTATVVGTKVLFAGGTTPENESSVRVDIYDTETGEWSIAELSQARAFWEYNSASRCDQFAYFVGGGIFNLNSNLYGPPFNTIDIYDVSNDEWTIDSTYAPILAHSVIGVEDHLLIAGGMTPVGLSSRVQSLNDTCIWNGVESIVSSQQSAVICYPNPTQGIVDCRLSIVDIGRAVIKVYNAQGQEVATVVDKVLPPGEHTVRWDASALPAGIYFYQLRAKGVGQVGAGKIVKY
jgi:hypothetical protein